mmetsp:Transcript_23038/g.66138  ORF Transcript_23038/g.66138 Transcript_23038/m.66138 type:complete len:244 (-) Transcript_23038:244-975(-)
MRIRSFSFSESFSSSAFFARNFFCNSIALASASSLLIFGFAGTTGWGFKGSSMSASSACSASQFTANSTPALSVLKSAFSAFISEKPISMTCLSNSWLTFSLISGGLGSPAFRSSGTSAIATSALASAISTSKEPSAIESRNSSVNFSTSGSLACSASQASAASNVPFSLVKCKALAARTLWCPFTVESASNFFWSTDSRNLFFLLEAFSFSLCNSRRYSTVLSSNVLDSGSRCFILCTSASV